MNKKLLIGTGVVVVIAIIVAVAVMVGGNNKEKKEALTVEEASAKLSAQAPFTELASQNVTTEELTNFLQIDVANVEKVEGRIPLMNVQASMYLVIEAKEGKVDAVKADVEAYGQRYEEQWAMYLPAQHELVQNRKIGTSGNLVYLIIAENAEELEEMIK